MLKITCNQEIKNSVIEYFVTEFANSIQRNSIQTLVCGHFDKNLKEKIKEIITETQDGFHFDIENKVGEEPYGFVPVFFKDYLKLLSNLKKKFKGVGIDGNVFLNDVGGTMFIYQQKVYATPNMKKLQFIN